MPNAPSDPRTRLARRELSSLRSEKTILVAIIVQLLVASFSSVLVVGVVSMYSPGGGDSGYEIKFGTVATPENEGLRAEIDGRPGVKMASYLSVDDALDAYKRGHVDALLYANRAPDGTLMVQLVAPENGFAKSAAVNKARDILQTVEEQERQNFASRLAAQPLQVPNGEDSAPYSKFTYTILLPVLMFLPAFVSGSLVSDSFTEAFANGTFDLLRVTPLSETAIFDAKVVTMVSLAPGQALLWAGLLYANGTPISNVPALIVVISGISLVFGGVGAMTALHYQERSKAQFTYALASMTVFASLYVLPESPANSIAKLALDNPGSMTYLTVALLALLGGVAFKISRRQFESN